MMVSYLALAVLGGFVLGVGAAVFALLLLVAEDDGQGSSDFRFLDEAMLKDGRPSP